MIIASFDIGLKNFAFCIEDTDTTTLLYIQNHDLSKNISRQNNVYHAMTQLLDKHLDLWDKVDTILVEKQMFYKHKPNTLAMRLSQHCLSYFMINFGTFKTIIEYPSQNKTRMLNATWEERKTKPNRKKFAIRKAREILLTRNDILSLAYIEGHTKKDDLSDVICQLEAYKIETL